MPRGTRRYVTPAPPAPGRLVASPRRPAPAPGTARSLRPTGQQHMLIVLSDFGVLRAGTRLPVLVRHHSRDEVLVELPTGVQQRFPTEHSSLRWDPPLLSHQATKEDA